MKLLSRVTLIFLALIAISTFYSCKKNTNTAKITKTTTITDSTTAYNISCTGGFNIGDTIWFHTSAPDTSNFQWNFGDSATATDSAPYHIFTDAGTFLVTLVINHDTAHKSVQIKPGVSKFAGTWLWTGGYVSFYGADTSTPHSLNDTTFVITVVNDSTINAWGVDMSYGSYANPHHPGVSFVSYITSGGNFTSVIYKNDTLFFGQGLGGLGGGQHVNYYTH